MAYFSGLGPKMVASLNCQGGPKANVKLIKGNGGENPFGGLNIGIIEVRKSGDHDMVNFKLIGYPPDEQWTHMTMFETGEL